MARIAHVYTLEELLSLTERQKRRLEYDVLSGRKMVSLVIGGKKLRVQELLFTEDTVLAYVNEPVEGAPQVFSPYMGKPLYEVPLKADSKLVVEGAVYNVEPFRRIHTDTGGGI